MRHIKFLSLVLLFIISATAYGQPTINRIWQFMDSVGLYNKFEISLRMDAEYENPFDPDQIDVMATFTAPSGKEWKVPGFFNQFFRGMFSVRFSPDELGNWTYVVRIKDKNGENNFLRSGNSKYNPFEKNEIKWKK